METGGPDMKDPDAINQMWKGLLAEHLGMRFVETGPDRVVAELEIRDHLRTVRGTLHGGTLMALADATGGTAALINLREGEATATIESKTNFFAAGRSGTVRAEATPLHKGRSTSVWQTRITDESGKLLSLTIQTQAVLKK
jgi:1,4-dihydroxy-2-naphthoyl-CoA hydrolase